MRRSQTLLIGTLLSLLGASAGACNLILGNPSPGDSTGGQGGDAGSPSTGSAPGESGGQGGGGAGGSSGGSNSGGAPSSGGEGGAAGSGTGGGGETPSQTIPCGKNGRGEQDQIFVDGDWEDLGTCDDPDECIDEETETDAPCAEDDRGTGERTCEAGTWSTTACVCNDNSEEYDALADACLVPIACDATAGTTFGGGLGTPEDPRLICTAAHLQNVQTALSASYILATSLDLSDVTDFVSVGTFVGEFDGAGRALFGLTLEGRGLFSKLGSAASPGTVHSLRLVDFEVTYSDPVVGALIGTMENVDSLVEDVHVVGGSVTADNDYVGGLIGNLRFGTVMGSSSSAAVSGFFAVGGLIGYVDGDYGALVAEVAHSWADGPVSGGGYVGGLIGQVYPSGDSSTGLTVTRSSASGSVEGTGNYVGGLVGQLNGNGGIHELRECSATGSVTGGMGVGGLIGGVYAGAGTYAVTKCSATGDVVGGSMVGGLMGQGDGAAVTVTVTQSFAAGNVSGTSSALGGLVGSSPDGHVTSQESYAFGVVSFTGEGSAPASVGALYGESLSGAGITFCVDRQQGLPHVGALGSGAQPSVLAMVPASFASQTNFPPSWDFDTVWTIPLEVGRPILRPADVTECPGQVPNAGDACTVDSGVLCEYASEGSCACSGGEWFCF